MIYNLLIFQAVLVLGIVLFTLGFLITSLKENEPRAAMMAGVLSVFLIGLEFGIYFFYTLGFFFHFVGMLMLGKGRHRLQCLYAGVPLEPRAHISPPCRNIAGGAQQMGPPPFFSDG